MFKDLSPEAASRLAEFHKPLTLDDVVATEDKGSQPGPEDFQQTASTPETANALSRVKWPESDRRAPDYRYISEETDHKEFLLTPDVLDSLIEYNHYQPYRGGGLIAFALRGAQLSSGHEVERAKTIQIKQVTPDHRHFRCVIGFYYLNDNSLTAFTGSTVPCRRAIYSYKHGGDRSNMLPTGMYTYFVWRHKKIRPALRLGYSNSDPETGAPATVLRNKNNYELDVTDPFNLSVDPPPLDNVHCSYYLNENDYLGAYFSSWGCLTVRGDSSPSHQWAKFQEVLESMGERARVDLLLATGKDAAILALLKDKPLRNKRMMALRVGSRGQKVMRLQDKLGLSQTGYFGPYTLDGFTSFQRTHNNTNGQGRIADGIYSRAIDDATGWGIFSAEPPTSQVG